MLLVGVNLIIGRGGGGSAGACIQWLRDDVPWSMQVGGWQGSARWCQADGQWRGGRREGAVSGPDERASVGVLAVVVLGVMWDGPPREWSVAAVMSSVGQKLSWPFPASLICRKSLLLRWNYRIQCD